LSKKIRPFWRQSFRSPRIKSSKVDWCGKAVVFSSQNRENKNAVFKNAHTVFLALRCVLDGK
ncbi:hypothetical protein, partial [Leptospira santarosai]|uniref:hypothetical protein n=1 Tax=Leptospira santarosai TaxID=28183 RepID=UPI0009B65EFD